jgi:amino acid transporter
VVAALALVGDIKELASATVLLLLCVFVVVNMALVILKRRKGEPTGALEVPVIIPLLGSLICLTLIVVRVSEGNWLAPAIAAGLLGLIVVLYVVTGAGKGDRLAQFTQAD